MDKEEIEELKDFTIDLTDIDELALGLEVCSKKSNMVIQLEQQCKKQKEIIDKAIEYINKCISSPDIYERFISNGETKQLLDILKEET